jgi:hypothetical protein
MSKFFYPHFFNIFTHKNKRKFELMTLILLDVICSRLSYPFKDFELFKITFEKPKITFNIQKTRLKKIVLVKKNTFKSPKNLKNKNDQNAFLTKA